LRVIRVCTLAAQQLHKTNGYLPGFGLLALRPDRLEVPPPPAPCRLLATVARLLEPPEVEGEPLVVRSNTDVQELAEHVVERVGVNGTGAALLRFMGEVPAERVLAAALAARPLLGSAAAGPLAVAPTLGVSLSASALSRGELLASVLQWSRLAPPLPGPVPARLKHRPGFLDSYDWVGAGFKDD